MLANKLLGWMDLNSTRDSVWFIKRLAANDTGASGGHQMGPYLPNELTFQLFPSLRKSDTPNPRVVIPTQVRSHDCKPLHTSVIWYNQKTRRECRMTGWGGVSGVVTDPESTGSLALFVFHKPDHGDAKFCDVWVCNAEEESVIETSIGVVDPGMHLVLGGKPVGLVPNQPREAGVCSLSETTVPEAWRAAFPSAQVLVDFSVDRRPMAGSLPDERLQRRRECEYEAFRSVERITVLPRVLNGFTSIEDFLAFSNTVLNRRKSRSGRSFELQLARIFDEERVPYSHGEISEGTKRPDFLFPSAVHYRDSGSRAWMLGVKTTCKDRWRQILNEADRIPIKHLATLQEGLSINQYAEMKAAGVRLVVPKALHRKFPEQVRGELLSLEAFICLVR